jgi:hypothetical protein
MPNFTMILGAPRTGTNFLCGLLNNLPRIRFYGEVFAGNYAFTCDGEDVRRVSERTGCQVRYLPSDPHVTQLFRDEPLDVAHALLERGAEEGRAVVGVKLFGYHLPRDDAHRLIDMCTIPPLVVKRRILDSYISKLKACKIQKWLNADTSRVRVEADIRDFEYFVKRHGSWYRWLEANFALPTLHYEWDILGQEPREVIGNINDIAGTGFPEKNVKTLKKQDRSECYEDSVINWRAFRSQLEERDLMETAMGYF